MTARRLKVKVCGMREEDNILDIAALKPDYMGFILYPPSPRDTSRRCIGPKLLAGKDIQPVMVTVDDEEEILAVFARVMGFRVLQLHGSEPPQMCANLRRKGFTVWKAIPVENASSLKATVPYEGTVDAFVLDTKCSGKGGSGRKFDWNILKSYDSPTPFMLSGGIGPEDAETIVSLDIPQLAGVDINSRFETAPAEKDPEAVKAFIKDLEKL